MDLGVAGARRQGGVIPTNIFEEQRLDEFQRRRVTITIENDEIGDGVFSPVVAATLRELAYMIDNGQAGRLGRECYLREDGTLAVITADDVTGVCIPIREQGGQRLVVGYVPDSA